MKKIIVIFGLLSVFLIPFSVSAESGKLVGKDEIYAKDIYSAPTARFYDFNINDNNLYPVTTQYSDGYGFLPDPITGIVTDNAGPGAVIGYDVHDVFITGYVYSIITYLCAVPSGAYPMINSYRTGIQTGNGLANTANSYVSGGRSNLIYAYNQSSTTAVTGTGNFYCGRLIHVFEATSTGTTIIIPFISSQTVSNWTFFGYSVTNYGQRNSLTSQDIQTIINTSTSTLNQNISNIESSINSNIDNTRNSIIRESQNTTAAVNNIDNTLNDDSDVDTDDFLDDWTNLLLENNAVNQILYLPVNVLTKVRNTFSGSCQSISLPFGITGGSETLIFPCWNIEDYVGSNVGSLITGFIGFYLIYYFALFLWRFYDTFTSLGDTLNLVLGNHDTLIVRGDNNG